MIINRYNVFLIIKKCEDLPSDGYWHMAAWNLSVIGTGGDADKKLDFLSELLEGELDCTVKELLFVFDKLKASFNRIKKFIQTGHKKISFFDPNYLLLLDAMYRFVRKHLKIFEKDREFESFKNELSHYVVENRGYSSLTEGIISKDNRTFISVLNEIIFCEKTSSLSEAEIQIIINRILLSVPENFIDCLDLLRKYIEKNNSILSSEVVQSTELVLRCLTLKKLQEIEVNVVLSSGILISIADSLQKSGRKSKGVDYWLEVKKLNALIGWG